MRQLTFYRIQSTGELHTVMVSLDFDLSAVSSVTSYKYGCSEMKVPWLGSLTHKNPKAFQLRIGAGLCHRWCDINQRYINDVLEYFDLPPFTVEEILASDTIYDRDVPP